MTEIVDTQKVSVTITPADSGTSTATTIASVITHTKTQKPGMTVLPLVNSECAAIDTVSIPTPASGCLSTYKNRQLSTSNTTYTQSTPASTSASTTKVIMTRTVALGQQLTSSARTTVSNESMLMRSDSNIACECRLIDCIFCRAANRQHARKVVTLFRDLLAKSKEAGIILEDDAHDHENKFSVRGRQRTRKPKCLRKKAVRKKPKKKKKLKKTIEPALPADSEEPQTDKLFTLFDEHRPSTTASLPLQDALESFFVSESESESSSTASEYQPGEESSQLESDSSQDSDSDDRVPLSLVRRKVMGAGRRSTRKGAHSTAMGSTTMSSSGITTPDRQHHIIESFQSPTTSRPSRITDSPVHNTSTDDAAFVVPIVISVTSTPPLSPTLSNPLLHPITTHASLTSSPTQLSSSPNQPRAVTSRATISTPTAFSRAYRQQQHWRSEEISHTWRLCSFTQPMNKTASVTNTTTNNRHISTTSAPGSSPRTHLSVQDRDTPIDLTGNDDGAMGDTDNAFAKRKRSRRPHDPILAGTPRVLDPMDGGSMRFVFSLVSPYEMEVTEVIRHYLHILNFHVAHKHDC